ncbi:hypothetical protein EJ08DRAFT_691932 [Tothia fuscella]|uniref:Inheritance of peroxisomes protein 1 n=1 Tax=Tothia fuscella TaxID=1048955 RepID=A0A9P4U2R3_9PEZI|nr:hypothetical protein EJ08DRAFT_691932 [Tothia fuscella]
MSTPSTPENAFTRAINHPGVRRVHTLPSKLIDPSRSSPKTGSPGADTVETLFVHPSAKVVSFTTATTARPGSSSGRRPSVDINATSTGTLSWTSPSERTLAAGPLRIYRVPSSGVSFLNSGSLLHPILQRSQCWCVDRESKFALRVRDGSFYRIDLPFGTADDKEKVEAFKSVLATILHFDGTPSPFSKEYTELPERPHTPLRRTSSLHQPAKRWRLNKVWEPEDAVQRANWSSPATPPRTVSPLKQETIPELTLKRETVPEPTASATRAETTHTDASSDKGSTTEGSSSTDEVNEVSIHNHHSASPSTSPRPIMLPFRPRPIQAMRSVTAPPPLNLQASPPSLSTPLSRTTSCDMDAISIASSHDSFHSVDEIPSPSIKTASIHSFDEENDTIREQFASIATSAHKRQTSEITVIPDTPTPLRATTPEHSLHQSAHTSDPATPTLIPDTDDSDSTDDPPWSDAVTPPDTLRMRRLPHHDTSPSHRTTRASDPITRPINLFSTPTAPSRPRLLTAALVQKAYALLIGPPAHLVALMLEIAAKIIHGIPVMYDTTGRRHRLPGSWEESSVEDEDEWDDNEDDFGVPLDNLRRLSASSNGNSSGVD